LSRSRTKLLCLLRRLHIALHNCARHPPRGWRSSSRCISWWVLPRNTSHAGALGDEVLDASPAHHSRYQSICGDAQLAVSFHRQLNLSPANGCGRHSAGKSEFTSVCAVLRAAIRYDEPDASRSPARRRIEASTSNGSPTIGTSLTSIPNGSSTPGPP
jgi:hypothetical protein